MKIRRHKYVIGTRAGARCAHCEQHARTATDDCPGTPLDYVDALAVKEGLLNFRDGEWVYEPSAAYQHGRGVYSVTEIDDEARSSLWNCLPFVTGALLLFVCIASIYELFIKAG